MAQPMPQMPVEAIEVPIDHVIVLHGVTWADYQRLLEIRGEKAVPRLTYLDGVLELMSPSMAHESLKSMIGRLVEAWCLERGVDVSAYGSWTLESKGSERGVEPDECYVLGDVPAPERPDLAIEVVVTAAAINKLDVYRKLRVREIWIWEKGRISVYELRDAHYALIEESQVLPGIDLDELLQYVGVRPMTQAVRDYRAKLASPSSE